MQGSEVHSFKKSTRIEAGVGASLQTVGPQNTRGGALEQTTKDSPVLWRAGVWVACVAERSTHMR